MTKTTHDHCLRPGRQTAPGPEKDGNIVAAPDALAYPTVPMTSNLRQSLVAALLAAGAPDETEAIRLADLKEPGTSWINSVLNSGKLDEAKLLTRLGETFRIPFETRFDATRIDRATLGLFPSRFVFQHHIVPLESTETSLKLATYDIFNTAGRQLASQLAGGKPIHWVLASRAQLLRTIKTLYGVGAENVRRTAQGTRHR